MFWASDDSELAVSTLSRQIAAIEQDITPAQATGEPYRNVYTALDQSHLPRLSDLGIVAYDDDRKIIEPGLRLGDALLLLELTQLTYRHLR